VAAALRGDRGLAAAPPKAIGDDGLSRPAISSGGNSLRADRALTGGTMEESGALSAASAREPPAPGGCSVGWDGWVDDPIPHAGCGGDDRGVVEFAAQIILCEPPGNPQVSPLDEWRQGTADRYRHR
jgi:hypothetical protein